MRRKLASLAKKVAPGKDMSAKDSLSIQFCAFSRGEMLHARWRRRLMKIFSLGAGIFDIFTRAPRNKIWQCCVRVCVRATCWQDFLWCHSFTPKHFAHTHNVCSHPTLLNISLEHYNNGSKPGRNMKVAEKFMLGKRAFIIRSKFAHLSASGGSTTLEFPSPCVKFTEKISLAFFRVCCCWWKSLHLLTFFASEVCYFKRIKKQGFLVDYLW
jgi:hypothetical protein